jgi:hypothetical protein
MRKLFIIAFVFFAFSGIAAFAQEYSSPYFRKGDLFIGPRVGLGSFGGAGLGLGANVEYGVTPQIGVSGTFGWSSYSSGFVGYNWTYTNLIIAVGGNYHFDVLKVNKLDTYAGLGLGYNIGSVSSNDANFPYIGDTYGGFFFDFRLGGRYFFTDRLAGTVELGYGFGFLRIGVDFKL